MAAPSSAQQDTLPKHEEAIDTFQSLADKMAHLVEAEKKKMDAWKEASQRLDVSQISDPVVFDVGGTRFATSIDNLRRVPDTYFSNLVSGRWELKRSKDGSIFIDRSPNVFGYLLEYMRNPSNFPAIFSKLTPLEAHMLAEDCEFYMMPQPLYHLFPRQIDRRIWSQLRNLIQFDSHRLLYQWSVDSAAGEMFHKKCDNQGHTIIIGQIEAGGLIGGFTTMPWRSYSDKYKSHRGYLEDEHAFLFTVKAGESTVKCYHQTNESSGASAVYHDKTDSGPMFGGGHDMEIRFGSFNEQPTCYTESSSYEETDLDPKFQLTDVLVFAVRSGL